jgi:hypothetical protein
MGGIAAMNPIRLPLVAALSEIVMVDGGVIAQVLPRSDGAEIAIAAELVRRYEAYPELVARLKAIGADTSQRHMHANETLLGKLGEL